MGVVGIAYQDYSINKPQFAKSNNRYVNNKVFIPILERNENDDEVGGKFSADRDWSNGWIRVYCGPDRSDLMTIEPSRMVRCDYATTARHMTTDLNLPPEYTIWMQIGGSICKRLDCNEYPLRIQDDFFKELGYTHPSRRLRLEIDPEMKYLLRFYIGPSDIPVCRGVLKSGCVDILKGLVFPQWQRRCVSVIGCTLFVFQGSPSMPPEIIDLAGAEIIEHSPKYERLILKILPKFSNCDTGNFYMRNNGTSGGSVYNSTGSIHSSADRERVLFLGFEESWERDLWSAWLLEACNEITETRRLDICNAGLQTIPEVVLQSIEDVEELLAGQNKLQEIGLKALAQFPQLQILRLPGNGFTTFPSPLLLISGLKVLDIADNSIEKLPEGISQLTKLEELRIDRNEATELPNSLRYLPNLRSLQASHNRISKFPTFMLRTKTMGLVDMYAPKTDGKILNNNNYQLKQDVPNNLNPPLTKVSLRANKLCGNIILGNYGYLTQLDVSENQIEMMDLSALGQLESLQCCRNKLVELTVNGSALTSLIAGNNNIRKLCIAPTPTKLRHLDVSYNNLDELPKWLQGCHELRTMFANNNNIGCLPEHIFSSERNTLHTLQLGYNHLKTLPPMPRRKLPLQELFLQCNELEHLPENFFFACEQLVLLNVSSNRLCTLPPLGGGASHIERLYATKNCLVDSALETLGGLNCLRVLHAAYNNLTSLPMDYVRNWPDLEELVLSGNRLKYLPENLSQLVHLKVLRVHSNQLQFTPGLAQTTTLRVLDLAHNQLDKIDLVTLVPKKLQFLDLSCNLQLQVDPKQLQACQSQRPMSLVDVSGKNRASLPSTPDAFSENCSFEPPWRVGFSETAGNCSKLYISQLRLPNFCNTEGLFGMFDGELKNVVPSALVKSIPKILLEERTVKETANEYMKYTLLSAHRELKQTGQKYGVCATLCHICREKVATNDLSVPNSGQGRRFVLRIATVGEAAAYLVRRTGFVRLTPTNPNRRIGQSGSFPLVVPDPEIAEVTLGEMDEFLIIGNKKLWEIMDVAIAVDEIRSEPNVILAAKRVQDIAQSFGAEENLSVVILKFTNLGTDMDYLIRELRQTVRKKPPATSASAVLSGFCKCGCCCETNNSCCHSGGAASAQFVRQFSAQSDRSSPSGQSDQAGSEINLVTKAAASTVASRRSTTHKSIVSDVDATTPRGVVRSKIVEEDREAEETDSALSEEQFKCWEYMLEQNTQLLFDKELNTISKAFTKNRNASIANLSSNLMRPPSSSSSSGKLLSASSPQLVYNELKPSAPTSFLSKQFGSGRTFQPAPSGLFKSMKMHSTGRIPPIGGGPNAAYFGSLQRLMPYNLEYDFAIMHERHGDDDSLEHESRMRQYWGVATTEL